MAAANGGDIDVVESVVVIVADSAAETIHFNVESGLVRYISKCAIVIIVIESRIGFDGAVPRPVHGIDKENILPAVIVVIDNANAATHGFGKIFFAEGAAVVLEVNAGLGGDVGEGDWAGRPRGSRCRGGEIRCRPSRLYGRACRFRN